jgi:fructose-1,6-bisphosphatase II / sedoheptulose-1,7-bisphosphatase
VVIGEGERDQAPMLFIGEEVGSGKGTPVDIAVDPLEGTTLCAKNQYDSLCVLAMSERGGLLHAPDVYMEKIAVGPDYPDGIIDLDHGVEENIKALARHRKVPIQEITACVLDRPRHTALIEELRELGVPIKLIGDGDIAGVIHTTNPDAGIDIYIGSGGAPEGVLAAAAMRCAGGQLQGRLILDTPDKHERAKAAGITDFNRKYAVTDLASGDVIFSATGVTDGSLLNGVRLRATSVITSSIVMRSWSRTTRWVTAQHPR